MKIIIYQENNPTFRVNSDKRVYDKADYHKVYTMDLTEEQEKQLVEDVDVLLGEIFEIFNSKRPEDFKGHSLTVGDIVEFRDLEECEKGTEKFICACFGWRRVEWK